MINTKNVLVLLTAGVVLFAACQSKKERLSLQIAETEKEVYETYSEDAMFRLVAQYQDYAKAFSKDSLSAEYLYRAADLNMRLKRGEEALTNLDVIIAKFPDSRRVADAYYLRGCVYEDVLYDIDNAINAYYDFVKRYPSHELALSVSLLIHYLEKGMTPDDIVASFEDSDSEIVE